VNKKIEDMKAEYMQISASDSLKENVSNVIVKSKTSNLALWKRITGIAACVAVIFTLSLNLSPVFAAAVADLPGMSGFVKVITFGRYIVNDKGYQADIKTPKIEGFIDKDLQDKLNKDFKDYADAIIIGFENDMKELKKEYPGEFVCFGIDSGYIIKTDNSRILSIDIYMVNTVGSSSTTNKYFTIDKKAKTLITLPSMFKPGSDYVTILSKYIAAEMKRQNEASEYPLYWDDESAFKKIKENQNFYINKDGKLVICFDKYDIGPGSTGCPEFVIPDEVIKGIIK